MIKIIENYQPLNLFEEQDKKIMIKSYETYGNLLFERFNLFHFSASGLVFNFDFTKVLLIHHKIYNSWGWMGGHMDRKTDFLKVATKEIKEESGLTNFEVLKKSPISIEILPVWQHLKNGQAIAAHQHYNVSFAFIADEKQELTTNTKETNGLKWVLIDDIREVVKEELMIPIYEKIIKRVRYEKTINL